MQPVFFFKVFGIPLFSYTTAVIVGVTLASVVAHVQSRRVEAGVPWAAEAFAFTGLIAVAAGRLLHVTQNAAYYSARPAQLLNFGDGDLSFVGVFLGGLLGLWLWSRWRQLPLAYSADAAALPVTLIACGAWFGALMRGSQYGALADNQFALELHDLYGVMDTRWATQLLAGAWCAVIGLCLIAVQKRWKAGMGAYTSIFLGLYALGIGALDFTRGDVGVYILGLRLTQWLYIGFMLVALFILVRRFFHALTKTPKITRI